MTRCIHQIDELCFDCRTPSRTPYRYRGEVRYWTRSQMAEKLTDGLRHQPQWTPPPGSSTDYDLNVELVEYFDRRLGEWKDGRVLARPQIPERDEIPAEWADLDGRPKYDANLRGGGVVERTSFPSGYGKEPWPKVGYRVTVIPNEDAAVIRQAAAWADHVDAEQAAYEGGSTPIMPAGYRPRW